MEDCRKPRQERIVGVTQGKFEKANLLLESGDQLGLSATNIDALVAAYGWESELWTGHLVELFVGEGEFNNKPVEMVLLKTLSPAEGKEQADKAPVRKKPNKPPQAKAEFDNSTVEF